MVILEGATAMRLGVPYPISLNLPILALCAVLAVVAFVALVFVALRSKDSVQAGLQLRPWSIAFSLEARNGEGKIRKSRGDRASKDGKIASGP
jgi:hypothetical protein